MLIKNQDGQILYEGKRPLSFEAINLHDAILEGMNLQGIDFSDTNLTVANLRSSADLHWAHVFRATLAGADLANAQLPGADLKMANLSNTNPRNANLGLDNVGGSTQLQGANPTGAILIETTFENAEYDATTVFPRGFSIDRHKMILKQPKT